MKKRKKVKEQKEDEEGKKKNGNLIKETVYMSN